MPFFRWDIWYDAVCLSIHLFICQQVVTNINPKTGAMMFFIYFSSYCIYCWLTDRWIDRQTAPYHEKSHLKRGISESLACNLGVRQHTAPYNYTYAQQTESNFVNFCSCGCSSQYFQCYKYTIDSIYCSYIRDNSTHTTITGIITFPSDLHSWTTPDSSPIRASCGCLSWVI